MRKVEDGRWEEREGKERCYPFRKEERNIRGIFVRIFHFVGGTEFVSLCL